MKKSPRILIFGDLHQAPNVDQLEELIDCVRPDKTVFLGDYFDQWYDHFDHAYLTAKWLKSSLRKDDRVHLWGNHDLPYAFPDHAQCPGFTPEKYRAVKSVLGEEDWAKLHLWHFELGWLFTHAGLTRRHLSAGHASLNLEWLESETRIAWNCLERNEPHWIWAVGPVRGGGTSFNAGGILWCDFDHEFEPIPGFNQVFGHTPAKGFRTASITDSQNWCIDVSSLQGVHHAALLQGAEMQTLEF